MWLNSSASSSSVSASKGSSTEPHVSGFITPSHSCDDIKVCECMCLCVCVCARMCVCVCVCICVSVCMRGRICHEQLPHTLPPSMTCICVNVCVSVPVYVCVLIRVCERMRLLFPASTRCHSCYYVLCRVASSTHHIG